LTFGFTPELIFDIALASSSFKCESKMIILLCLPRMSKSLTYCSKCSPVLDLCVLAPVPHSSLPSRELSPLPWFPSHGLVSSPRLSVAPSCPSRTNYLRPILIRLWEPNLQHRSRVLVKSSGPKKMFNILAMVT